MDRNISIWRKLRPRHLIRTAMTKLPQSTQHKLLRHLVKFPTANPHGLELKMADTLDEYKQALAIVQEEYERNNLAKPTPEGIRVTKYHALRSTSLLVAKIGDEVVATVTLIRDGKFGMPLEDIFDVDEVRQRGVLGEVSALAVKRSYRKNSGAILFPLLRYLKDFATDYFGVDFFVMAVAPAHFSFYQSLLGFNPLHEKAITHYDFVEGHAASGGYLDLRTLDADMAKLYSKVRSVSDGHKFFFGPSEFKMTFPTRCYQQLVYKEMGSDIFNYLFNQASPVLEELDRNERKALSAQHGDTAIQACIWNKHKDLSIKRNAPRLDARAQASITSFAGTVIGEVTDVSRDGIGISTTSALTGMVQLSIALDSELTASVRAEVKWSRDGKAGLKIDHACERWLEYIGAITGSGQQTEQSAAAFAA